MEEIVSLIQRAQAGDAEAYGQIVSRFQDMAYAYAYAILGDFEMAQDAAQEALIDAYQSLPDLREPLAFPAWLKRIVHRRCDRMTRGKRHSTVPLETAVETASPQPGPAEVAERRELAQRVQDAIRELPVPQRVVTTLFYINGYSHQQIADFIEAPVTTVKSRLHASRGRLREKMIDMVEDELKANALPADFTKETVEEAVARAAALNKDRQFDQAEQLLRQVLAQAPENPEALKELNRTLMWGRVFEGRWELLPELARQGRIILQAVDDEYVHHELARTLLAIPAMPEAIAFLEDWIAKSGTNLERLGMLSWAKSCVADYEAAENIWREFLKLAKDAEWKDVLAHVPFVTYTLVDSFASAKILPQAQEFAREGWDFCLALGRTDEEIARGIPWHVGYEGAVGWLITFRQAEMDLQEVVQAFLPAFVQGDNPHDRGAELSIRSWVDDPATVAAEWLEWARERISAGDAGCLWNYGIRKGLLSQGEWRLAMQTAQAVWEALPLDDKRNRGYWEWQRIDPLQALWAGDIDTAEELNRREMNEFDTLWTSVWVTAVIAAVRGAATPPQTLRFVEETDPGKYTLPCWYIVAREAAAAGDEAKAFDALRKTLSYWTNSPHTYTKYWENDAYWGDLRNHPEFKAAFEEKRKRIGPMHGQLHYFPGW